MKEILKKYCTGCGLCESQGKAVLCENAKGYVAPESGEEEWLSQICPIMGKQQKWMDFDQIWGRSKGVYLGWSKDPVLREKASSGGVLTELASFLLSSGKVDCIIHTCVDENNPTKTMVCYSRTREELVRRCGSRYSISHPLSEISKLDRAQRYAIIAKPCDIVALHNYMELEPDLKNVILYTLSFFCMGVPSVDAQNQLLSSLSCTQDTVKSLTYRGNGWPGETMAIDLNEQRHTMDYNSSWGHILGRDLMDACRFCIDGVGESADIACGDAWYLTEDGGPDFSEHKGRNIIFTRTDIGEKLVKEAYDHNLITLQESQPYQKKLYKIQYAQFMRRASMKARVKAMRLMKRSCPPYTVANLKRYSYVITKKKQIKTFLGTCKRIVKGNM